MNKLPEITKGGENSLTGTVIERLRDHIMRNCHGRQKFLSERQLAEHYNISRITIGKAIRTLVQEGLLYQLRGSGTYVAEKKMALHKKIGLIVYHCDNPFYSKIIKRIQQELDLAGFHAILVNTEGNPHTENLGVKKLKEGVDGFVIAPVLENDDALCSEIQHLINQNFPTVLMCHAPSGNRISNVSTVIPNYFQGGYSMTQYLIGKGYRKIIFLSVKEIFQRQDIMDRYEGYKKSLHDNHIPFMEDLVINIDGNDPINGFFNDGCKAANDIIPLIEPQTAVFAIGDSCAIGLMRGLRERGISTPEDLGICGFDDIELAAQWGIDLTTIRVDFESLAKQTARIIIAKISEPENRNVEHVICPVELVPRKSA